MWECNYSSMYRVAGKTIRYRIQFSVYLVGTRLMLLSREFNGVQYDVTTETFTDVIKVFVYKKSRIAKVYKVPLQPLPGGPPLSSETEIILPGITPEPLVGTSLEDNSGNLYASIIASMISRQCPDDNRLAIIGLGPMGPRSSSDIQRSDRDELLFVTKLVQDARSW